MKAAAATTHPNLFFDSAAVSLSSPRPSRNAARTSRRVLFYFGDSTGNVIEVVLRLILGASVFAGLLGCAWQAAQH